MRKMMEDGSISKSPGYFKITNAFLLGCFSHTKTLGLLI